MKITMIKMMMIMSTLTLMIKTPMSMGISLLIQTMIMITVMNKMMTSSWFIMITFLMMIGGLLILFTYMSSIASNEKFKMNLKSMLTLMIMLSMFDEMMIENQIKETQELTEEKMEKLSMSKMYSKTMMMTMLMVLYLLITMIVIAKIVKHHEGPLRSKTYEQINTEKKSTN
uniref:NADH dehydrogenase subunit 6 n=1 Tax=Dryodurgades formosana TaxID=3024249 RepID=UPI0023F063BA|nr:NADH dehydrogenase subunit 6 [Dryodurgades formosana]WDW30767.1 NADH dehydrogenase subunit 6 [Dryodurgades formosana]